MSYGVSGRIVVALLAVLLLQFPCAAQQAPKKGSAEYAASMNMIKNVDIASDVGLLPPDPCAVGATGSLGTNQSASMNGNGGMVMNGSGMDGTAMNGMSMNGMAMNGTGMNGMPMNSMGMNGMAMNDTGMNGMAMNGMGMNSMGMNSMGMNSMGMNNMGMNNMGMNGMGMNGMGMNNMGMGMQMNPANYQAQQQMNTEMMKRAIGVFGASALLTNFVGNGGIKGMMHFVGWDRKRGLLGPSPFQ